jgi:hypothetical protein
MVSTDWPGQRYAEGMKLECVAINDTSPAADWRNKDIPDIIQQHGLSHIQIIPFYDLTAPLWTMHVNGHMRDCTHFCWTPMLYQPLFHYFANSVQ